MHHGGSANMHHGGSANMHHDGADTPDKGLTEASTDAQLVHPLPCLLAPPLGTADLAIE